MKRHHKILVGTASTIVIVSLIIVSLALNSFIIKQEIKNKEIENKISSVETNLQDQINEIAVDVFETKYNLESNINDFNNEIDYLKANVNNDFSGIIENSIKGIITIRTLDSQGTGFLITENGYLVTNVHVIVDENNEVSSIIQAITNDREIHNVKLIGGITKMDLALLKIEGSFDYLTLGDSNEVQLGEPVIAIGNPEGLQFSVTEGIVSAKNREGLNELPYYIQTSAALNKGNSGGPLINKKGEVIGMNNFKLVESEGIGFALESNQIKEGVNIIGKELLNQTFF